MYVSKVFGGLDYSEGSAILVCGLKPKRPVVPKAYIKQRSLNHSPRNFFARSRACIQGPLRNSYHPALGAQTLDGDLPHREIVR